MKSILTKKKFFFFNGYTLIRYNFLILKASNAFNSSLKSLNKNKSNNIFYARWGINKGIIFSVLSKTEK